MDAIANLADGWSGNNGAWTTATISLPTALDNNSTAQFRFLFASDAFVEDDGVAFDNFTITGENIGYTGPGGVGNTLGTSILATWLRADDLDGDNDFTDNPGNGTSVSSWNDYSGNSNHYTNSGTNRPTYQTTGTFNAVDFDASLGTAQFLNGVNSGTYTNGSAFIAINPTNSGISNSLLDNTSYSLRIEQINNSNVMGYTRYGVLDYYSTIGSPFGADAIVSYHKSGTSTNIQIIGNGTSQSIGIGSTAAGIPYDRIGKNSSGADEASGDFYEILIYKSMLNSAQIIIVNNYLSAKYGGITIPNDIYNEDNAGNGNYDYEVAGIGRIDDANQHTDAQGTGIVRILNPTGLGDDEFLIWGHDNGSPQATELSDVPAGVQARFERVWRVSEVNSSGSGRNVGNIDMRWDLSGLGAVTATDLRLLVDSDNDGTFADETAISGATSLGSNIYAFTGVSAITNNRRFTIGTINSVQTPLPIELLNFHAVSINDQFVQLKWETAAEINNDFFTIEKSRDGMHWETALTTKGAGNSDVLLHYEAMDKTPFSGTSYYRLKQTDFDGQYSYSEIKAVKIKRQYQVRVYPNPTRNQLTIEGTSEEIETLSIYNSLGQNVSAFIKVTESNESGLVINLSNLTPGLYTLKTKTTTHKVYKE